MLTNHHWLTTLEAMLSNLSNSYIASLAYMIGDSSYNRYTVWKIIPSAKGFGFVLWVAYTCFVSTILTQITDALLNDRNVLKFVIVFNYFVLYIFQHVLSIVFLLNIFYIDVVSKINQFDIIINVYSLILVNRNRS